MTRFLLANYLALCWALCWRDAQAPTQLLELFNALLGPGRFFSLFILEVLYDIPQGYGEPIDLHGPAFSILLDLSLLHPAVIAQRAHRYAYLWLPEI